MDEDGQWADKPFMRTDNEGNVIKRLDDTPKNCGCCKWWKEQGLPIPPRLLTRLLEKKRAKDIDFQPTITGWCKRMPHTEIDKDKDDCCGEFEAIE